ncbi:hypothetical protein JCM16307_07710 [Thermococcus prieurii]
MLKCNVSDAPRYPDYYAKVGLRTTGIEPIQRGFFEIWISEADLVNFTPTVLPDAAFAQMNVPVTIYIITYNSNGTPIIIAKKNAEVKLKMSIKDYVLSSLIWGLLGLLFLFIAGYTKWDSGKGLVGDLLSTYLVFRGAFVPSLSALLMMPFTTFSMMSNGRSEASALVLSGLSALLLFESAYAYGIAKSKYPKVSFYTGLGWLAGLPLAFSFHWSDYFYPFALSLLIAVPIMVILWRYAELPYSKCRKILSLFRTYSVPLSIGVALVLALHYTTEETTSLFAVLIVSLFIYALTSKLAFERLEWAKRKFDEDIGRIEKALALL